MEEAILAERTQIIWVLEEDTSFVAGTAASCRSFVVSKGSDQGLCVGDGQTEPTAGVFDASGFALGRGFDIIVRRSDMRILFSTSHGTPRGNDNLTGAELLAELRRIRAGG